MRRLLAALLVILAVAIPSYAATTYTTYYHLAKQALRDPGWDTVLRSNFDLIDSSMHSIVTAYTALVASEASLRTAADNAEATTRGTQDAYLYQQVLLKYGDLVARLGSLPEVYVLSSTFNGPTGVSLALPKSVDSVNEYAIVIEPTTRSAAIGDIYTSQGITSATVHCSAANTTDTFNALIIYREDTNPYGTSLHRRWYVSPLDAITNHSDNETSGSLAWVASQIGGYYATVELPGNHEYIVDDNFTLPANIQLLPQAGAIINRASGKSITFDSPSQISSGGHWQLFMGSGQTHFTKAGTVYPAWFGAVGDGVTESATAITEACNSLPDHLHVYDDATAGVVQNGAGEFLISSTVYCRRNGITFRGQSAASTRFKGGASLGGPMFSFARNILDDEDYGVREDGLYGPGMIGQVRATDFQVQLYDTTSSALHFGPGENQWVKDVWIQGTTGHGASTYGIYFDGDHYPMWSSLQWVDGARISGFGYGIRSGSGSMHTTNSIIEYNDYGLYCDNDEDSGCSIGKVDATYFQSNGYGVWNTGSNGEVKGCWFEQNTTKDYDDNNTNQAHNALLFNSWTLQPVTFLPYKVSVNKWTTVFDRWLPNQLAGVRNTAQLNFYNDGTGDPGPGINMYMTGIDSGSTWASSLLGLNTHWGGTTGTTDPFGRAVAALSYGASIYTRGQFLRIGTGINAAFPVEIYTGGVKRASFSDDNNTFHLNYGSQEYDLDFHLYGCGETDGWDGNCTSQGQVHAYGPILNIMQRSNGIRIGPRGNDGVAHPLWQTALMGNHSVTGKWVPVMTVNGFGVHINSPRIPASATASGSTGQFAWDADYVYVCIAPNTWKRAALSTW